MIIERLAHHRLKQLRHCLRFAVRCCMAVSLCISALTLFSSPLSAVASFKKSAIQAPSIERKKDDACMAILEKAKSNLREPLFNPQSTSLKADIQNQHSQPVTLGFLMGIRYVVGPKELATPVKQTNIDREIQRREYYAMAVARYRACKNSLYNK